MNRNHASIVKYKKYTQLCIRNYIKFIEVDACTYVKEWKKTLKRKQREKTVLKVGPLISGDIFTWKIDKGQQAHAKMTDIIIR